MVSETYRCFVNGELVDHRKFWATPTRDHVTPKGERLPQSSPNCIPTAKGLYLAKVVNCFNQAGQRISTDAFYEEAQ
jgi:hypothetical protein